MTFFSFSHFQILLIELGFDEGFITPLREHYLHPLTSLLYPDCGGRCLDSHKAFVVKYDMNEDLDLSYHYDNAEVTLNVSLGKDFTEGNLYFGDMRQVNIWLYYDAKILLRLLLLLLQLPHRQPPLLLLVALCNTYIFPLFNNANVTINIT